MDLDLILEPDISPAQIVELGKLADDYGFRTLWIQNYVRARDAFMSAVPLAMATRRLRAGVVVVSPYEMHPLKIANAILTLAEYADGRADVVVGAGGEWNGVIGVDYGKRVTTAREAQEIITRAVAGKPFTYQGKVFKAYGFATPWFKSPKPLIYAGASGEKLLAVSAERADGVMMSDVQIPMLPSHLPHLTNALDAQGRAKGSFRINNFIAWHVKKDAAESFEEARRELMIRGWLERPWLEPFLEPDEVDLVETHKDAYLKAFRERHGNIEGVPTEISQKLVDGLSLAGDEDSIDGHIEHLRQFAAAGFTEIALRIHDDPDTSIRMIGERVLPALR
jgi:5,10-methylenetetrahydromethanopterin reductase